MRGIRFIFPEFNLIFVGVYFINNKIHHFKFSIFSFGNNKQSCSCHSNQDVENFYRPKKFPVPWPFLNLIPLKFLSLTL